MQTANGDPQDDPGQSARSKEILGHPAGLFVLFATEMWERFSFYGMKAILLFYLVKYHLFGDEAGNLLIGSYAALVYALPVLGGVLADRYLGFRKAVVFGGVLLVFGHLGLAYEGEAARLSNSGEIERDHTALQVFYFSLALIIMGVGFLKANISSIVGKLYATGDPRRESGFTIFYMGINLGSALATFICGYLGETYGWGYGFGAAGIGMTLGLITFLWGQKYLHGKAEPPSQALLERKVLGPINMEWTIYLGAFAGCFLVWQMVQRHSVVEVLLLLAGAASLVAITYYMLKHCSKVERDRLIALTVLILFSVIFWALFEQAYTSLNLYADRVVQRELASGFIIPAPWFLSLNATFIILFAPVFAWLWVRLDKFQLNPNAAVKFAFGILLAGLGFGALVLGAESAIDGKVFLGWLVVAYLLHTWGELCLSPVGLSTVTKLAPEKIVGFMMGVWFLATAGSEYIAALLANLASMETTGGEVENTAEALANYSSLFYKLFIVGGGFGFLLLLLSPIIKRLMHGIK
jgi:POT family proton-dependent oligopeptide transporter